MHMYLTDASEEGAEEKEAKKSWFGRIYIKNHMRFVRLEVKNTSATFPKRIPDEGTKKPCLVISNAMVNLILGEITSFLLLLSRHFLKKKSYIWSIYVIWHIVNWQRSQIKETVKCEKCQKEYKTRWIGRRAVHKQQSEGEPRASLIFGVLLPIVNALRATSRVSLGRSIKSHANA